MSQDMSEIEKLRRQAERKKAYNKKYYQEKVKPQKEKQKKELEDARARIKELEDYIVSVNVEKLLKAIQERDEIIEEKDYVIHQLEDECNKLTITVERITKPPISQSYEVDKYRTSTS